MDTGSLKSESNFYTVINFVLQEVVGKRYTTFV